MNKLYNIELDIIKKMAENCLNAPALLKQIENVTVTTRENTGGGFYTYLQTLAKDPILGQTTIGNVFAQVFGFENPMTFVLYITDGYIKILEGATVLDNSSDVNFENVKYSII